jgi:hypothetical protein
LAASTRVVAVLLIVKSGVHKSLERDRTVLIDMVDQTLFEFGV